NSRMPTASVHVASPSARRRERRGETLRAKEGKHSMKKRMTAILAASAATALALTGCAADPTGADNGDGGDESKGSITLAVFNGWDEGIASSLLWEAVLEEQ